MRLSRGRVRNIEPAEADRLLDDDEAVLLDVREPEEWRAGHAPGAIHMPMGALRPDRLPADTVVVAVCRSGHRSALAAAQLQRHGTDVLNLAGGMKAWAACGLPVLRDDGSAGTVA
ncbi:MAG: rhodanese-like domain-containing protein [Acidimicrobiales bacterium]